MGAPSRAERNMQLIRATVEPMPSAPELRWVRAGSPILRVIEANAELLGVDLASARPIEGKYVVSADLVDRVLRELEACVRRNPRLELAAGASQ